EEEIIKEQITFANEEIERLEKDVANKKEQLLALDEQIKGISEKIAEISENVSIEVENIEKQRVDIFERKNSLINEVNPKIIQFYEKIRRWAGNTTVVPVRKQACFGCFMKLNDKIYADVIRAEDITVCPHCGRILYIEKIEE
ncbi:MAG: hypothetical protein HXX81_06070, partial [Campylobacterales bacterium]|nr:hypothetical protein [Campylobacterales bacterium]